MENEFSILSRRELDAICAKRRGEFEGQGFKVEQAFLNFRCDAHGNEGMIVLYLEGTLTIACGPCERRIATLAIADTVISNAALPPEGGWN